MAPGRWAKRGACVLLLGLAPPPAHAAFPIQLCTVTLGMALPGADAPDPVLEARAQIAAQGCEPGDALVVVGSAFEPRALAALLCRRGAGVQVSEMPGTEGASAQLDCELPALPRTGRGRR